MRHGDVIFYITLTSRNRRAASVRLFVFYLYHGMVRVCEIELSHMGKHNGNYDLVCEKWI